MRSDLPSRSPGAWPRSRPARAWLGPLLAVLAGCASPPPERPPQACRDGSLPDGPWFTDVSDAWGLRELGVDGNRLSITDLDGDKRPDVAVSRGTDGARDDFADPDAVRQHFLLRNTGERFEDVTLSSGITTARDGADGRAWNFAVWGDVDNDGDLDAVTFVNAHVVEDDRPDRGDRSEVLLNDGAGHFTLAEASDLQTGWLHTTAASLLDADRDAWLDVFVGNQYGTFGSLPTAEQDLLLRGLADGRFRDQTAAAGLETERGGTTAAPYVQDMGGHVRLPTFGTLACDIDGDGDTDLLTQTYGRGLNQFWESRGDGTFVNRTENSRFFNDADLDGDDYSGDQRFRCYCQQQGGAPAGCAGLPAPVIACSGNDWTPGWDDQAHRLGGNTFSATCGDLDGDGDLDVATGEIRHWWTPTASDPSTILWNDGASPPVFERRPRADVGIEMDWEGVSGWNEGDLTVATLDFDHDGVLDLIRPQSDYPDTWLRLFRGLGDGTFEQVERTAGIDFPRAAGIGLADFDGDGDEDVLTSFSRMRCDAECAYATPEVHLFRNDVGQDRNTLVVDLEGGGHTNRAAIGARVTVRAGGRTLVREVAAGEGHQGVQHQLRLHIGLGEACVADSVEVRWPDADGTVQTVTDIPANHRLLLAQGEDPVWPEWDGR